MTAADANQEPRVTLYDAKTGAVKLSFLAYDASVRFGVRVALGDVNGDGKLDVVVGHVDNPPGANTTYLNVAFLCLAGLLVWRFYRTGGRKMLAMMGGSPDDPEAGHSHQHHDHGDH